MANIALVGCAHIHTPGFIKRLNARADHKVTAVWDHDLERAKKRAAELNAAVVESVEARVKELSEQIAGRAQVSVRGAKKIINSITDGGHEDDFVRALYAEAASSADYAEGVSAFLEKRPPRF